MNAISQFFQEIFEFFQTSLDVRAIEFWDVLDIIIMWLLIYSLLKLIHGTRAMQMAIGIIALFVIQFVADLLQMTVLSGMIASLFTIIPIAIIILFENEIRKVLSSLGRGSFFGLSSSKDHPDLDYIFFAVRYLAERNVGALIVFEGRQGLKNYIEVGTELDALPSSELLLTIFNTKSNLHDGAVIISGNRVASAASVLPLSNKINLPRHFGTRHRAAIGLSEETDCVVVVVSEESGRITFAKDGEAFTPNDYSIAQLKNLYFELMENPIEIPRRKAQVWRDALLRKVRTRGRDQGEEAVPKPEKESTAAGSEG